MVLYKIVDSKVCDDCRQKQLEEKNEKNKRLAKERRLKQLTGTPKQTDWANTIRQDFIDEFEALANKSGDDISNDERVFAYVLENRTQSSYWIDHRGVNLINILRKESENATEFEVEQEVRNEAVVYPKNRRHKAIAYIKIQADEVVVEYEKNDEFIDIVKGLSYRWDGTVWAKEITNMAGPAEERAAELGNTLLINCYHFIELNKLKNLIKSMFLDFCYSY